MNPPTPHGRSKFVNDLVRTREERLRPEWVLVPLAIAGGLLVGFGLKRVRQPAARFLLPGRTAYDVAQLVTPRLRLDQHGPAERHDQEHGGALPPAARRSPLTEPAGIVLCTHDEHRFRV